MGQLSRDHQCRDCNLEESGTDLSGSKQGRLRLIEVEPGLGDREEQAGRTAMRVSEMQGLTQLLALGLVFNT